MRGLLLAVLVISLSSCEPIAEMITDELFEDYPVITRDLESAWQETATFKYSINNEKYWKSPKEFKHDGWGDCEDFATYLIYQLGPEAQLAIVQINGRTTTHALVYYKNRYIEPQTYGKYYNDKDFKLIKYMSYTAVMKGSTAFYTK